MKFTKKAALCIAVLFFFSILINIAPCSAKIVFYPLYREVRKMGFIRANMGLNMDESSNFKVYYKETNPKCIKMILDNGEDKLKRLEKDFNFIPDKKICVIVYPEYEEMAKKIGLGTGSTAMGVYYGGIISILDPGKWINDEGQMIKVFNRDGPMVHELTHYLLDYITSGNIPVWFTEGVALYEEYRVNNVEWAANKQYADYYEGSELEKNFYELDEVKAYKESFLVVKYIGDNYGMDSILLMLNELKEGKSMEQAIRKTLGMDMNELFNSSLK